MAPMAGITDAPFRMRLRRNGCRSLATEMISATALVRENKRTLSYLNVPDLGDDLAVQIFGAKADDLAGAAELAQEAGFTRIDFNMGCPARKIIRSGSGSALLANPALAEKCLTALRRSVKGFFSIKIRSGWDDASLNFLQIGRMAVDCGVDSLTLHPRTRAQGFSGRANWLHVEELARNLSIPVVGNGDVDTPETAVSRLQSSGCAGVMIGRGALAKPWIFDIAEKILQGCDSSEIPHKPAIGKDLLLQMSDLIRWKSSRAAVLEMRKFLIWASKGMEGAADLRRRLIDANNLEAMETEIKNFFELLP